ncbi:MAG: preprotein translocase subunit SecE [bacterium]
MLNQENMFVNYIKESYAELKKVVWPGKKDIKNHTIVVIVLSLVLAVFLGLLDYIFTIGLDKIIVR